MFLFQYSSVQAKDLPNINNLLIKKELQLEEKDITPNKEKRQVFKSFMNSLVGKFSQRSTYADTKFVATSEDIEEILNRGETIEDFTILSKNICELQTDKSSSFSSQSKFDRKTNPVIAAFVTALSRIDMHKYIMLLPKHSCVPMYTDTDSLIFYSEKLTIPPLPISTKIGDFCKEYQEYENPEGFCSIGKKNYVISLSPTQNPVLKVRGISFKGERSREGISFDTFYDYLSGKTKSTKTIPQSKVIKKKGISGIATNLTEVRLATQLNFNRILKKQVILQLIHTVMFQRNVRNKTLSLSLLQSLQRL